MSRWSAYYPRWPRPHDDPDPVQPHSGAGRELEAVCLRCGDELPEDRGPYCELCKDFRDEPLDTEGE